MVAFTLTFINKKFLPIFKQLTFKLFKKKYVFVTTKVF